MIPRCEPHGRREYCLIYYILIVYLLLGRLGAANAQDTASFFFYQGYPYGSQASYNPGSVVINGGYGIWQVPSRYWNRGLFRAPYGRWWRNTWSSVGHPVRTIEAFGWERFLNTEILPADPLNRNREQFIPNYFLHGIGAGMHFRATAEWYAYHRFPHPRLWSLATMAAYHLTTEVVENGENTGPTVDAIADLYVFNPLGILLFSSDRVCRFFSGRLHLAEWSQQPAYNARTDNLENMGQFYVVRLPLDREGGWSAMAHFGLHGMLGLSRQTGDGRAWSATVGLMVEDLEAAVQEGTGQALAARLSWSGGIFYDRNNSLMASLMVSGLSHNRARLNIYPGVLRRGWLSPGISASWGHELVLGINLACCPLGIAWGSEPR
jgi:hypothetical protein